VLAAIAASADTPAPAGADDATVEQLALDAAAARGVLTADGSDQDRLRPWLGPDELDLPAAEAALRVLVRSFRQPPDLNADALALDALRNGAAFALARDHVARARRLNAAAARRDPSHAPDRIPVPQVRAFLAERWHVPPARATFELALLDRGILASSAFEERLRAQLPYAALGRVPRRFAVGSN
jgi:hypothetical protein